MQHSRVTGFVNGNQSHHACRLFQKRQKVSANDCREYLGNYSFWRLGVSYIGKSKEHAIRANRQHHGTERGKFGKFERRKDVLGLAQQDRCGTKQADALRDATADARAWSSATTTTATTKRRKIRHGSQWGHKKRVQGDVVVVGENP